MLRVRLVLDLAQGGAVGQSAGACVAGPESASGLQGLEASAYRFSMWLYRPWGGCSPPLRACVEGNPKQAAKRGIGRSVAQRAAFRDCPPGFLTA